MNFFSIFSTLGNDGRSVHCWKCLTFVCLVLRPNGWRDLMGFGRPVSTVGSLKGLTVYRRPSSSYSALIVKANIWTLTPGYCNVILSQLYLFSPCAFDGILLYTRICHQLTLFLDALHGTWYDERYFFLTFTNPVSLKRIQWGQFSSPNLNALCTDQFTLYHLRKSQNEGCKSPCVPE